MSVFIHGFEIDAAVSESDSRTATVTDHNIEDGADITDHIVIKPRVITLECIVSNTPIGELATRRAANTLPAEDAAALLNDIWNKKQPVTIQTANNVHQNMVLRSLSVPRNKDTGDALSFRAEFKAILTSISQRVTIKVDKPRLKKKAVKGKLPTKSNTTAKDITPAGTTGLESGGTALGMALSSLGL